MNKLSVVQLGFGSFGKSWFEDVLPKSERARLIGAVSSSEQKRAWIEEKSNLKSASVFGDLDSALRALKPDVLLCVTPPSAHKENVLKAIRAGVAVICEKPVAESWPDAEEINEQSLRLGVPVVIAENYRYMPIMRRAREIVASGMLGRLHYVNIDFYRQHSMGAENYHNRLKYPLMLDVAIHNLDCLRFITGLEAEKVVSADMWDNDWSPYSGNSGAVADIELVGGVRAQYFGSLSTHLPSSEWSANWRIDGELGQLRVVGNNIYVDSESNDIAEHIPPRDGRAEMLDEILSDLAAGRRPTNILGENMKTFRLTLDVIETALARNGESGGLNA